LIGKARNIFENCSKFKIAKKKKKKKFFKDVQMTIHVHKSSKLNQKNKDYQQNKGSKTH
jgi:hypothetical protein